MWKPGIVRPHEMMKPQSPSEKQMTNIHNQELDPTIQTVNIRSERRMNNQDKQQSTCQ